LDLKTTYTAKLSVMRGVQETKAGRFNLSGLSFGARNCAKQNGWNPEGESHPFLFLCPLFYFYAA